LKPLPKPLLEYQAGHQFLHFWKSPFTQSPHFNFFRNLCRHFNQSAIPTAQALKQYEIKQLPFNFSL